MKEMFYTDDVYNIYGIKKNYNYLRLMMYQADVKTVIGQFDSFVGPDGSRLTHNTNGKNRLVTDEHGSVLSGYFFSV